MTDQLLLQILIDAARYIEMTERQKEEQRKSFVYGNCALENPLITKCMVDEVARKMRGESK